MKKGGGVVYAVVFELRKSFDKVIKFYLRLLKLFNISPEAIKQIKPYLDNRQQRVNKQSIRHSVFTLQGWSSTRVSSKSIVIEFIS